MIDELEAMVTASDIKAMESFLNDLAGEIVTEDQVLKDMPGLRRLVYSGDKFRFWDAFSAVLDASKLPGGLDDAEGGYLVCKTAYRPSQDDRDCDEVALVAKLGK